MEYEFIDGLYRCKKCDLVFTRITEMLIHIRLRHRVVNDE